MKQKIKVKTKGGNQELVFISSKGIQALLKTTSKHVSPEFLNFIAKNFSINMEVIIPSKESQHISTIIYSFADYETKTQQSVGPYYIDLAFPSQKIAVECDENGHDKYDPLKEVERQRFLENRGYKFVRFNPDDPCFNIGRVIYQIRRLLS
jgi:very-short-patch-repair endonuclease